jgi:predicted PurR-regulated permease PerM
MYSRAAFPALMSRNDTGRTVPSDRGVQGFRRMDSQTAGKGSGGGLGARLAQIALWAVLGLLAWRLTGVILISFSAILIAAALTVIAQGLRRLVPLPRRLAIILATLLMFGILAAIVALYGWRIAGQFDEIFAKASQGAHAVLGYAQAHDWSRYLLQRASGAQVTDATDFLAPLLGSLLGTTTRYLAYGAIMLVCGIFLALDPDRYRRGLLVLVPAERQSRAQAFLDRAGATLNRWLVSRLVVMGAIGVLASAGLMALGIPAALTLGLTGALLTFIPYLGALMAAAPAVLVAFTISPSLAVWTGLMFWGVHFIEGTFITPIVQDEEVSLPPVLTIFGTLACTVLFGPSGIVLASPLILVLIVAIQVFYLEGALGRETMALAPSWFSRHGFKGKRSSAEPESVG